MAQKDTNANSSPPDLITRLTVENYQSIGQADLELGPLTVIVGPGMLGKSALLRAFSALLTNETGTEFIRHGQKRCEVTVSIGDPRQPDLGPHQFRRISWQRDTDGARYVVQEGEEEHRLTKLGGAVPSQVAEILGIRTLAVDKGFAITPQMHTQFESPLLLTESAGKIARALAQLTKLGVLAQAQVLAARDLHRARQEIGRQTANVKELTERLAEEPDVTELGEQLAGHREVFKKAVDAFDDAQEAGDRWREIEDTQRVLAVSLPDAAALVKVREAAEAVAGVGETYGRYKQAVADQQTGKIEVDGAEQTLRGAEARLEEFMAKLETCPLCGSVIDD